MVPVLEYAHNEQLRKTVGEASTTVGRGGDFDNTDLLWIRRDFISSDYDWGKVVVYGHTPLDKPFLTKTRMGLDSGCVYGRQLTCCEVRTRQIWQA